MEVIYLTLAGTASVMALTQMMLYLRQRSLIMALDGRLAHLAAGVTLLTDTTEGGLRDVALEINRQAQRPTSAVRPSSGVTTQRRVAGAARLGRSAQDIAAAEQISESEVYLRMNLDKSREELAYAPMR